MEGAAEAIKSELLTRDGATVHEHQFGSVVFRAAGEEIGHLHLGSAMADIHIRLPARLPAKTIKKLLSEGRVSCAPPPPHYHYRHCHCHVAPQSGWASYEIGGAGDIAQVIGLLRTQYERPSGKRHGAACCRRQLYYEAPAPPVFGVHQP